MLDFGWVSQFTFTLTDKYVKHKSGGKQIPDYLGGESMKCCSKLDVKRLEEILI